jgi:hypothetical protein
MPFFKKLSQFINDDLLLKTFIIRFERIYCFCLFFYWVFFFTVYFMKINLAIIFIPFLYWVLANIFKDSLLVIIYLFLFNFIYSIIYYYVKQSKIEWNNSGDHIKWYTQINYEVQNTWIFRHIFLYLLNLNILLIFVFIVTTNYFYGFKPSISVLLSLKIILLCIIIFIIYWLNYFYCYYKYEKLRNHRY